MTAPTPKSAPNPRPPNSWFTAPPISEISAKKQPTTKPMMV